jgi:CRISPR-associated protein Csd2
LEKMWWVDHSAARPAMTTRGLYVFSHESSLGNAPWQRLTETIRVEPVANGEKRNGDEPVRSFADYSIKLPRPDDLPRGVMFNALVD